MTTSTPIHPSTTSPARPAFAESPDAERGFPALPLDQLRHGTSRVGDLGRRLSRWSPERERPEDDEAVVTAVSVTVTHRSGRERPEDDEVIPAYTREPACRSAR
jgi:hypothetical protein